MGGLDSLRHVQTKGPGGIAEPTEARPVPGSIGRLPGDHEDMNIGAGIQAVKGVLQALAGILLPSTTVFAVLLCNDRAVLGPWINRPWLNALAGLIVGVLLLLSFTLVISTVFPSVDVTRLIEVLAPLMFAALLAGGVVTWWRARGVETSQVVSRAERENWRMPALALLERPKSSALRRGAMLLLSGYVVLAAIMLAVKAVQIALIKH